ncbi:MAG TPA: hypothetical protein VNJ07_03505 [Chitinophagales bacterium]|nr:hypothetical protein [Chitinophagales bacterium]
MINDEVDFTSEKVTEPSEKISLSADVFTYCLSKYQHNRIGI